MSVYEEGNYRAKVILDSISPAGVRLLTLECRFPRPHLAEFNTHRRFSRNSASSRAIPVKKQIDAVRATPYIPIFTYNEAGMQGKIVPEDSEDHKRAVTSWLIARDNAVYSVQHLVAQNIHKQATNRLLEPFMWHTVIVSATEWNNFFIQRCSPLASPEMEKIATLMKAAHDLSVPEPMPLNHWHLPYILEDEMDDYPLQTLQLVSSARCARVSYNNHDGIRRIEDDLALGGKLMDASPPHWSPLEHIAQPDVDDEWYGQLTGNFDGWRQLRRIQENFIGP